MCLIDNYEINNLLDQRTEHFKIINFSSASFQRELQFEPKESIHTMREVVSTIDGSLMKWLES